MFGKYSETFVWPSDNFWRTFGKWSEIFGKLRKPLRNLCKKVTWSLGDMKLFSCWKIFIFGKCLENILKHCLAFGQLLKNLWKSSENSQKSLENCLNPWEIYVKKLHGHLEIWNSSHLENICQHSKRKFVSLPWGRVVSSIYTFH